MTKEKVRIGEAAKILGVTAQTLRNWEKSGKLRAHRSLGGQRYYERQDLERFAVRIEDLGWAWASSAQPPDISDEYYCDRQDRFASRLEKMSMVFLRSLSSTSNDTVSLLTLVAGEVGDNSFAHNIGNWPDMPGIFFAYDVRKRMIVLADRGRGVRATLQRVRPNIISDTEALRVAFTEIVSGRDPERRGNGLKVVLSVAETNTIGLSFRSGLGTVHVPKELGSMRISTAKENVRGAYAVITF